jgi:tight adherence protein B
LGLSFLAAPYESFDRVRRQAGIDIPPLTLLGGAVGFGAALWVVSLTLLGGKTGTVVFANAALSLVGAFVLSFAGLWLWVSMRRNGRLKKLEEQLPLALDVVTRALRAGHPVVAAVHLAAQEMGDPLGSEFGLIVDETTYGGAFKDALASFAERTGSPDAHFFAVSVAIQSETGGNLSEILEGLAAVMRSRATLGKKVVALSSEGKASAYMLSALPILMVGFQMTTNPVYYTSKFGDPVFWPITIVVVVLYFSGWLMVNRIINFKY